MRDFATEIMAAGGVPTRTSSIAVKLKYRMPLCLWHEYQDKRIERLGLRDPPQVCERLAAFAPTNAEWMRGLADAYDIIGNEQAGADQLAGFRNE
jgi:hypothetical protein